MYDFSNLITVNESVPRDILNIVIGFLFVYKSLGLRVGESYSPPSIHNSFLS